MKVLSIGGTGNISASVSRLAAGRAARCVFIGSAPVHRAPVTHPVI